MKDKTELSPAQQKQQEGALKRFHDELKKQPEISDEEFMAEFEVSDEEYKLGLVLPGIGNDEKE
jgi:hypothetical protein